MEVSFHFATGVLFGNIPFSKCIHQNRKFNRTMALLKKKWQVVVKKHNTIPKKKSVGKTNKKKRLSSMKPPRLSSGQKISYTSGGILSAWATLLLGSKAINEDFSKNVTAPPRTIPSPCLHQKKKTIKRRKSVRISKGAKKDFRKKLSHIAADLVQDALHLGKPVKQPTNQGTRLKEQSGKWLAPLDLDYEHRFILQSNEWLDDKLIDAAQTLLKRQFQSDGLQSCLLAQIEFQPVSRPAVQIHYDEDRSHWFTSCFRRDRVEIADSMFPDHLSLSAKKQIQECYKNVHTDPLKSTLLLNVDQQPNINDCGLYAIANAFEVLSNRDPTCRYNNAKMRQHLLSCLEKGLITEFPKSA